MEELTAGEFYALQSEAAEILGTAGRPLVVAGEAILGIEAAARCLAAPGRRVLNLATGPYGRDFGVWLRDGGADVREIAKPWNEAAEPREVEEAIRTFRPEILSYVYAEAVTGGVNPLREIQTAAVRHGVLTFVDAVSSVGADPFRMDEWGVDMAAVGLQKALRGSNGISFLGLSARALDCLRENGAAPRRSLLSLAEQYERERDAVPPYLSVLEARDALRAFGEIRARGGVRALEAEHRALADSVRGAVRELGYRLYQKRERDCTALDTVVLRPETPAAAAFRAGGIVTSGNMGLERDVLRINHYGVHCTEEDARQALETLRRLL